MQHTSRRALREAAAAPAPARGASGGSADDADVPDDDLDFRPRWYQRPVLVGVLLVVVLALGLGAWLGMKAFVVKTNLEAAQAAFTSTSEGVGAPERIALMADKAHTAAGAADDVVWRAAEWLPWVGPNLHAVRLTAQALDVAAGGMIAPIFDLQADGQGNVLGRALPTITAGVAALDPIAAELRPVATGGDLIDVVQQASDQVLGAADFAAVLPGLLGADGERRYLLAFQNNAEALPLGGSAASQTLITVDDGQLQIARQASSADFVEGLPVDVPVDQSALDLYSDYLVHHVNTTMSRPDFPTAARLLSAFWQRDIDAGPIDAVISVDPIALGRILLATGPIEANGHEITSKNAVSVLLKDAYQWWDPYASKAEALASDAFFAGVAGTVFTKIAAGQFDVKDMLWAVNESIAQGDILAWSEDPLLASTIDGSRASGVLPTDNADATTVGVFFRDTSASKIDYYLRSQVALDAACTADQATFTAQTKLHLDLTQAEADALPRYVQSFGWGSEKFRTEVFVYGPPGTTFASAEVDGSDVLPLTTDVVDLGRPVAKFQVFLRPGEEASVTARFTGAGTFGPLEARVTPMIKPTEVTLSDGCR